MDKDIKSNVKVKFSFSTLRRHIVGVEVQFHSFLSPALDELSGQPHAPAAVPPGTHWTESLRISKSYEKHTLDKMQLGMLYDVIWL
jgi:hypothetical protein